MADYQLKNRGDAFVKLDDLLASEKYGIGFLKGNTELKDKVQEDIYTLYEEGKVTELADKYNLGDFLCIEEYKNK